MTSAEARVLAALRAVTADGWPATVREVAREACLASPATALTHLNALAREGLAEANPRTRTGWRAIEAEEQPTGAVSCHL